MKKSVMAGALTVAALAGSAGMASAAFADPPPPAHVITGKHVQIRQNAGSYAPPAPPIPNVTANAPDPIDGADCKVSTTEGDYVGGTVQGSAHGTYGYVATRFVSGGEALPVCHYAPTPVQ